MAYKVIVRRDLANGQATWEPGCPLVVSVVQVSRNVETGACYLQAQLKNVSGGVVPSALVRLEAVCLSGEVESSEARLLDLDLAPGMTRDLAPVRLRGSDVATARARVEEAGAWRGAGEPGPLPAAGAPSLPGALAAERAALLAERGLGPGPAEGSALVEGDGWWRCPCGGLNVGTARCGSCGQDRGFWRQAEDPGFLAESAAAREEAAKAKARKRRRALRWAAIACAVLVAIGTLLSAFSAYQERKEQEALEASRQDRYEATYDSLEFKLERSSEETTLTIKANEGGSGDVVSVTVDWGGHAKRTYRVSADGDSKELVAPSHVPDDEPLTVRVTNSDTGEELFSGTVAAV